MNKKTMIDLTCDEELDDCASTLDENELRLLLEVQDSPSVTEDTTRELLSPLLPDYLLIHVFQTKLRNATANAPDTYPVPQGYIPRACPMIYHGRSVIRPAWLQFKYTLTQPFMCSVCGHSTDESVVIARGELELMEVCTLPEGPNEKPDTLLAVCENCFVSTVATHPYPPQLCSHCMTHLTLVDKCLYCRYYFYLHHRYLDVYTYPVTRSQRLADALGSDAQ